MLRRSLQCGIVLFGLWAPALGLNGEGSGTLNPPLEQGVPIEKHLSKLTWPVPGLDRLTSDSGGKWIVAVRGRSMRLAECVRQLPGVLLTQTRTVVTALVESRQIPILLANPEVEELAIGHPLHQIPFALSQEQIKLPRLVTTDRPLSRRRSGIAAPELWDTHQGKAPLMQPYTGKGVLLAVIESVAPDYRHPDFRESTGRTRFQALWEMYRTGVGPEGYGYGKLYDRNELDTLLATSSAQLSFRDTAAHPTHSLGVAAGNGNGHPECIGVAPEATLMYVAIGYSQVNLIDAVAFVFREADRLQMPCVVSISLGLNHLQGQVEDGRDIVSVALSEMVDEDGAPCTSPVRPVSVPGCSLCSDAQLSRVSDSTRTR